MQRAAPARAGEGTVRENTAPPRPHELHTTPLGAARLCKNLGFAPQDVMRQCIRCIAQPDAVYQRKGKNWYITSADCEFVVNAGSGTVITAHRRRKTALDKPFPLCYLKKQQLRCCFLRASRHFVPGRLRS